MNEWGRGLIMNALNFESFVIWRREAHDHCNEFIGCMITDVIFLIFVGLAITYLINWVNNLLIREGKCRQHCWPILLVLRPAVSHLTYWQQSWTYLVVVKTANFHTTCLPSQYDPWLIPSQQSDVMRFFISCLKNPSHHHLFKMNVTMSWSGRLHCPWSWETNLGYCWIRS